MKTSKGNGLIHVLHVGPGQGQHGGVASVMKELAQQQDAFLENRIKLDFFETYGFKSKTGVVRFLFVDVFRFLAKLTLFPDIVHFHVSVQGSFVRKYLLFLLANVFRRKAIFHLHAGNFSEFEFRSSKAIKHAINHFLTNACATVAVSRAVGQELIALGVDESRVYIVGNSARLVENSIAGNGETAETANEGRYVAFAGRLTEEKGVKDLLTAIGILRVQGIRVNVRFAGAGNLEQWIDYARSLDISDQVAFVGWIGGAEKVDFYRKATLFCMPSHHEAFGISTLEAMFCSLPVIGTDVGGFKDLVADQVSGFLVERRDCVNLARKIGEIFGNPVLAEVMGAAGFQRAMSNYSGDKINFKYRKCYFELMMVAD